MKTNIKKIALLPLLVITGLTFASMNNIDKASKWMKNKKFDLPVHVPDREIPREIITGSIPTTIIVDKQNNIIGRQVGGADYMSAEVIELMKNLLNEK